MPLYEYVCSDCDRPFEALVLANEAIDECPHCHGHDVTRQLSLPAAPPAESAGGCDPSLPPCNPMCCRLPSAN